MCKSIMAVSERPILKVYLNKRLKQKKHSFFSWENAHTDDENFRKKNFL